MKYTINNIKSNKNSPVIFFHGFLRDSTDWNKTKHTTINIEKKINKYVCTIMLDFSILDYLKSFDKICFSILNILINNNINRPWILVGHSIGGLYVKKFVQMYPEFIGGILLIDSCIATSSFFNYLLSSMKIERNILVQNIYINWIKYFYQLKDIESTNNITNNITKLIYVNIYTDRCLQNHINKYFDGSIDKYKENIELVNKYCYGNINSKIFKYTNTSHMLHHKKYIEIINGIMYLLENIK